MLTNFAHREKRVERDSSDERDYRHRRSRDSSRERYTVLGLLQLDRFCVHVLLFMSKLF